MEENPLELIIILRIMSLAVDVVTLRTRKLHLRWALILVNKLMLS